LGPRILILNSIAWQFILYSHWLKKDEEAIDWSKGLQSFHWTRGTSSRKVMEAYQGRGYYVYVERKKRKGGSVRKNVFSPYVWRGVHGKGVCKNQTWKEVVCNKYL
jgi:hypothetical protein